MVSSSFLSKVLLISEVVCLGAIVLSKNSDTKKVMISIGAIGVNTIAGIIAVN